MKYSGLNVNDTTNGEGVCASFWTQGCPFRCPGCQNPQTWDKEGGIDLPPDIIGELIKAISANGIQRNLSILGGEPLAEWNRDLMLEIITKVRIAYPNIKIFLWTGYTFESLQTLNLSTINSILDKIDVLIDGPFIQEKRDITLKMRGSTNQHIRRKDKKGNWYIDE